MSKGKTWQRVASAFLAAVMTFSTFSTTIAYAAEATTDSSITTDAVSDTDAVKEVDATDSAASSSTTEGEVTKPEATEAPAATETPDETDATEPEETPAPTEAPTPTPEPTESPEATAEPEPTEEPEETETPDVSESDFVAVGLADDATEGQIDAEIGDEVTFNAHVNRDDVNLQYQWHKRFIEPQTAEYDEDLIATYAAGVQLDSQSNPQWVTGLSAGMEYLTADMYAKIYGQDGKGGWLAEGKITPQQADMYWSYLSSGGFKGYSSANVLDFEGFPTGSTRRYRSFDLTDGKLEINSEWYGKTVYFRYHNNNIVGNTATGTAVSVPAAGRGTSYKDAVQVLFCYVIEENGITLPLTIKEYVTQATHNGYSANNMAHVTLNTISANSFNIDPDQYLKDAEGNYRNDSVYWGTCYYSEPDLSGKAYYALKKYDRQLMSDMYEAMMMVVYDAAAELKGQWDTNGKMTLQNPLFAHTAVTIFNGLLGATTMRYKVLKDTPAGVMEGMHIESAAV